jgi:hypothetical protein
VDPAGAADVVGQQISARVGTSDREVAPGRRLTLMVDVVPGPTMHVYAPGQEGYIPITLTLAASGDYRAAGPRFPPPGTYFFAPLKETVRVYGAPFRITQEITLSLTRELRERAPRREQMTIVGELAYQACDDTVCYRPVRIPVSWKLPVRAKKP